MKKVLEYGMLYLIGLIFIIGMFINASEYNKSMIVSNHNNKSIVYNCE